MSALKLAATRKECVSYTFVSIRVFFFRTYPFRVADAGASRIQSGVSQSTSCIQASKLAGAAVQLPSTFSFADMIG